MIQTKSVDGEKGTSHCLYGSEVEKRLLFGWKALQHLKLRSISDRERELPAFRPMSFSL